MRPGALPARAALLATLVAACGGVRAPVRDGAGSGAQADPAARDGRAEGTVVSGSVVGLPLLADAWPLPAPGASGASITDGDVRTPFVPAEPASERFELVVAVAGGRREIAAIVLWLPEGQSLELSVATSTDAYPLVDGTWRRFVGGAAPQGRARVSGDGAPCVVRLPAAVEARRVWLSLRAARADLGLLSEISALDATALAAVEARGARVVPLDGGASQGHNASDPAPGLH